MQELPGAAGPARRAAGWHHGPARRATTLPEESSSLEVLCGMEFKEDAERLLAPLPTLPSTGLPTLLAYRRESSRENMQIQLQPEEDCAPWCEHCGSPLRPFPAFDEAHPVLQAGTWEFCCQHSRDLYEFILKEKRSLGSARGAAGARESQGTEDGREKERAYQRQLERLMARQVALLAAESTTAAGGSSQANTISYLLSREPPSPTGWTLEPRKKAAEPKEEPVSYSVTCWDLTLVGGKVVKNELLVKYYKHGGKFLTMLPDGTAQLLYPSGNLAVVVVREKNHLICIVREDKPRNAKIQAVFQSSGRSSCYHPNGAVWININIQGGEYFDRAGSRVRRWIWPNSIASPGPHVPLRPIFLSLNLHVGVRILAQDKIVVSFLAMGQQAKFSMGTKVQVSDGSRLPPPARLAADELLLLASRVRILQLLDRLHGCLNFPSNEQRDRIKPPSYLVTQTSKLLQLCSSADSSSELRRSLGEKVNAEV